MDLICTQNEANITCSIPFPEDNGVVYNNIISSDVVCVFLLLSVMVFLWVLERIYYYVMFRPKKSYYDDNL